MHGFYTNAADYFVLDEPYFDWADVINGQAVAETAWVDGSGFADELSFVAELRPALIDQGFDHGIGVVVDTSRNGWGGPGRPTGPGPETTADAYVDGGRLDRRAQPTNTCNQEDAGLGERPVAAPLPGIGACTWIRTPGKSDGRPTARRTPGACPTRAAGTSRRPARCRGRRPRASSSRTCWPPCSRTPGRHCEPAARRGPARRGAGRAGAACT